MYGSPVTRAKSAKQAQDWLIHARQQHWRPAGQSRMPVSQQMLHLAHSSMQVHSRHSAARSVCSCKHPDRTNSASALYCPQEYINLWLDFNTMVRSFWKVNCCCWSSTDNIAAVASLWSTAIEALYSVSLASAFLSFMTLSTEGSLHLAWRLITSAVYW